MMMRMEEKGMRMVMEVELEEEIIAQLRLDREERWWGAIERINLVAKVAWVVI